jgi:hypothetical protein
MGGTLKPPMKYSLRSLMIAVLAGPPALAWLSFSPSLMDFAVRVANLAWIFLFLFVSVNSVFTIDRSP